MSARRPSRTTSISRRRFVSLLAAGSAAALAPPVSGAPAPPTPAAATPEQKEFDRQRANTLGALKTLREFKLPPGGDLPVVFRPLVGPRRSR